jgi:hypothetical protein
MVLFRYFPEDMEENHKTKIVYFPVGKKTKIVYIVGVSAKIPTLPFQNM